VANFLPTLSLNMVTFVVEFDADAKTVIETANNIKIRFFMVISRGSNCANCFSA